MTQFARRFAICFAAVFLVLFAGQSSARTKKHPPAKPIDLNTATLGQLEELPGVGPVTAKDILDFRAKSGPFKRVDDLLSVHRISQKKLDKLRPYVTVGPAHHSPANQPTTQPAKHPQ
ncbi:MAG TPA: helix-hairpin-helix domain-containing protein [Candidatus Dormibacteraeota bacterium]|nr:helix-hairpin-helix domain-containing protein [Candidatus Dormibacteraeota bacterium]